MERSDLRPEFAGWVVTFSVEGGREAGRSPTLEGPGLTGGGAGGVAPVGRLVVRGSSGSNGSGGSAAAVRNIDNKSEAAITAPRR